MKTIRLCLFGALTLFLCTFIVGTFFDYEISHELFHNLDTFGLIVSVIGPSIGYGMFAFLGGGLFAYGLRKNDYEKWLRVFFILGSAICLGVSTYFAGREFFGLNGFYWVAKKFWGYFIAFPVMVGITYLGYLFFRKSENKNLWILFVILIVAYAIALTAGISLFKVIFHRPRYRSVMNDGLDFYPWYERCSDYEELMRLYELPSEEFKSFPSGHSATAVGLPMMALFLPFVDKKYKKLQLPIFFGGLLFAFLVMFSRIYVGAHYLSDVSMGAIITIALMIVALESTRYFKKYAVVIQE